MTSRERVELALQHKEPDRVPIDIWGSASRINTSLYKTLAKEFNLDWEKTGRLIRPGKDTEYEDYALADALGGDFRHINIGHAKGYKSYKDEHGWVIDEWGIGRSLQGLYPTIVYNPLKDKSLEEVLEYKCPNPYDEGRIEGLEQLAKDYYENTDKYVTACSANSGQVFDVCQYLRGTEGFLLDLYAEEELAMELIKKVNDFLVKQNMFYLEPIAPYIGWVEFTSDFGAQNAPFISCELFRKFFKEAYTELFMSVKKRLPHLKIFMHSCGSVKDLIGEFIDCGVDVMNPLQPLCRDMDSASLKALYGDKVVFHGAIDIQQAMAGSLDDVRAEAKKRIYALGQGGGYIFSPSNHLQRNIPPENVVELFKAAQEYGVYPLK